MCRSTDCLIRGLLLVLSLVLCASQRTGTTVLAQPQGGKREARGPQATDVVRNLLQLIRQRAAEIQVTLPGTVLEWSSSSRCFDTYPPREPAASLENPGWRSDLETSEDGSIVLDLMAAEKLATLHSDAYRSEIESLLLAALEVRRAEQGLEDGSTTVGEVADATRKLDAAIHDFDRHRQEFQIRIAVGDEEPQRCLGVCAGVQSESCESVGYLGLVRQYYRLQLMKDSLSALNRAVQVLDVYHKAGAIDLTQVDRCRQQLRVERTKLHWAESEFRKSLDTFKVEMLGLPADVSVQLVSSWSRHYDLTAPYADSLADRAAELAQRLERFPQEPPVADLQRICDQMQELVDGATTISETLADDMNRLDGASKARQRAMTDAEAEQFGSDNRDLRELSEEIKRQISAFSARMSQIRSLLAAGNVRETADMSLAWVTSWQDLLRHCGRHQSRIRVEAIVLDPIEIDLDTAISRIRQRNERLPHARLELSAAWQGLVKTPDDGDRDGYERYEGYIEYQRLRRTTMRREDSIESDARQQFADLPRLLACFELHRQAVAIAIRRIEVAQLGYGNVPPAQGFQPPPMFDSSAAGNLFDAITAYRDARYNLACLWLAYQAVRIRLEPHLATQVRSSINQ